MQKSQKRQKEKEQKERRTKAERRPASGKVEVGTIGMTIIIAIQRWIETERKIPTIL